MPNASQCWSKSWHWSEMPLNADRFLSIWHWEELIGIDRHWDHCQNFDQHWALIEGVLISKVWNPLIVMFGMVLWTWCFRKSCACSHNFWSPAWTWMLKISRVLTTCQPLPESLNLVLIEEYDYQSHSPVVFRMFFISQSDEGLLVYHIVSSLSRNALVFFNLVHNSLMALSKILLNPEPELTWSLTPCFLTPNWSRISCSPTPTPRVF